MFLHCTKKLLEQLNMSKADLDDSSPVQRIFSWHAHIVSIARGKTLVAINDQTFYALIMPQLKKKNLLNFASEFYSALSASLKSEGFNGSSIEFLFGGNISYTKSYSRQILGIINDAVKHVRYHVEDRGGWEHTDIVELTKRINRIPWLAGTRDCIFAIQKIAEDLKILGKAGDISLEREKAF
ncbi:hypothetical protein FBR05_03185 [Deltaproteobacteria bacterium PRO3]|nr:hypothetical protein [Deltaproteobacteria bacterium PRO3]